MRVYSTIPEIESGRKHLQDITAPVADPRCHEWLRWALPTPLLLLTPWPARQLPSPLPPRVRLLSSYGAAKVLQNLLWLWFGELFVGDIQS